MRDGNGTKATDGKRHRALSLAIGTITAGGAIATFAIKDDVIALGQSMLYAASGGTLIGTQVTPSCVTVALMTAIMLVAYVAAKTIAEGVCSLWREQATPLEAACTTLACVAGMGVLTASVPVMPSLAVSAGVGAIAVALLMLWTCLLRPDVGKRLSLVPLARRAASARDASHAVSGGMASPQEIRDWDDTGTISDAPGGGTSDWRRTEGITRQGEPRHAGDTHDCDDGHQPEAAPGDGIQPQVADRD
jgi:hypothetical protein